MMRAVLAPSDVSRRARTLEEERRTRRPRGGLSFVPAAILVAFLTLPLIGLLSRVVSAPTLLAAVGRPIVLEALRLSLITTCAVLVLALAFGSPLALLLARRRFPGSSVLDSLVDLPI